MTTARCQIGAKREDWRSGGRSKAGVGDGEKVKVIERLWTLAHGSATKSSNQLAVKRFRWHVRGSPFGAVAYKGEFIRSQLSFSFPLRGSPRRKARKITAILAPTSSRPRFPCTPHREREEHYSGRHRRHRRHRRRREDGARGVHSCISDLSSSDVSTRLDRRPSGAINSMTARWTERRIQCDHTVEFSDTLLNDDFLLPLARVSADWMISIEIMLRF